jgi:hypothetical protein
MDLTDVGNPNQTRIKYMRYTQPKIQSTVPALSVLQSSTIAKFGNPVDSNDPSMVNSVGAAYEADE